MCTQEHESMTVTRCAICFTQTMGDPKAFYNKRIKGWMCGICHANAKDKLMAWLKYRQENKA